MLHIVSKINAMTLAA